MFSYFVNKFGISTHTLTWSVTIDKVGRMIFVDNFNSHAHVERDPCGDLQQRYVENFNSHAHVERDRRP